MVFSYKKVVLRNPLRALKCFIAYIYFLKIKNMHYCKPFIAYNALG